MTEQKDEFLKMEGREFAVHTMEWVCHGVGYIFCEEVFAEVENVFSCLLDCVVLGLCDAPSENVDAAFIVGEVGAHFLAEDDARQVRDF